MAEEKIKKSVDIVIFGATGDLSRKKLLPSLFTLWVQGYLPEKLRITAFSRREWTDEDYRAFALEFIDIRHTTEVTDDQKKEFLEHVEYHRGDFRDEEGFQTLQKKLASDEEGFVLYYLAAPPASYDDIFKNIKAAGLHELAQKETRICIEKPFGSDLKTAKELDAKLAEMFREKEIYRIDHYLAKDALQNVLTFRFTNRIFEDSWDNRSIEKVAIRFHEDIGVDGRGEFYDSVGALRDVGQNHILQMLAMVAMKNPIELNAKNVRRERENVLSHLKVYAPEEIKEVAMRAQYDGYRDLPHTGDQSQTETYFQVKALIDNDEWRGVPFYLEGGKNLSEKKVEIEIVFRPVSPCVCAQKDHDEHKDVLLIKLSPDAGIDIIFWGKKPGVVFSIEKQKLSFRFGDMEKRTELPEAYETVLFEAIKGDPLLFTTSKEVESAWKFITPIVEHWDEVLLQTYRPGDDAPQGILPEGL